MTEVTTPAAELDDANACNLMVLYNYGDWLTPADWATVVATTYNGYDYHDCDRIEPTQGDVDAIVDMIPGLLAHGMINEVDGHYNANPRARAALAEHSLGFNVRRGGLNTENFWSSDVIGQRLPEAVA